MTEFQSPTINNQLPCKLQRSRTKNNALDHSEGRSFGSKLLNKYVHRIFQSSKVPLRLHQDSEYGTTPSYSDSYNRSKQDTTRKTSRMSQLQKKQDPVQPERRRSVLSEMQTSQLRMHHSRASRWPTERSQEVPKSYQFIPTSSETVADNSSLQQT